MAKRRTTDIKPPARESVVIVDAKTELGKAREIAETMIATDPENLNPLVESARDLLTFTILHFELEKNQEGKG